jgi:hypothetical protein
VLRIFSEHRFLPILDMQSWAQSWDQSWLQIGLGTTICIPLLHDSLWLSLFFFKFQKLRQTLPISAGPNCPVIGCGWPPRQIVCGALRCLISITSKGSAHSGLIKRLRMPHSLFKHLPPTPILLGRYSWATNPRSIFP